MREFFHLDIVVVGDEVGHRLEEPRLRLTTRLGLVVARMERCKLLQVLSRPRLGYLLEHPLQLLLVYDGGGELGRVLHKRCTQGLGTSSVELAQIRRIGKVHKVDPAVPEQLLAQLGRPVGFLRGRSLHESSREQVAE